MRRKTTQKIEIEEGQEKAAVFIDKKGYRQTVHLENNRGCFEVHLLSARVKLFPSYGMKPIMYDNGKIVPSKEAE